MLVFQDVSERRKSDAKLSAYAAQESGLARIARRGLTADRPQAVLGSATRVAARALGADLAALYRYDGDRMVRLTSFGSPSLPRAWKVCDFLSPRGCSPPPRRLRWPTTRTATSS